ncbi:MAG TPA: hypothetical protein VNZ52_12260, partial [Candidatus Thermoplasmatota archaeon]|nr:hypothetical protein [Candidatus Thermoplasmatota archaeon]
MPHGDASRVIPTTRALSLLVLAALVVGGCLSATTTPEAPGLPTVTLEPIGTPIVQDHDHFNASEHTASANLRFVAWNPLLPEELGTEGFAGMRIVDHYAYVGTDGAHAGFVIVDLRNITNPTVVSQYVTPGGASQEAVPTWDGKWVFLNLQRQPSATALAGQPDRGTGTGIQIINVEDKANPRFESFFPVEVIGTHVMYYYEMGGKPYLIFNGQPLRQGVPGINQVYTPPPGNVVKIAEFVEVNGVHTLRLVSEYRYTGGVSALTSQGCFPHDMWVEEHPVTKQQVMYVSHWDCGLVTVDVTDPAMPRTLGVYDDMAPSTRNRIHFARPDPVEREGRIIAYSGPEIDESPGEPGYIRAYDITDPAAPNQIAAWRLPGEVENTGHPFLFTPHNFDFPCSRIPNGQGLPAPESPACNGDRMAIAHYHAGVWVLNI